MQNKLQLPLPGGGTVSFIGIDQDWDEKRSAEMDFEEFGDVQKIIFPLFDPATRKNAKALPSILQENGTRGFDFCSLKDSWYRFTHPIIAGHPQDKQLRIFTNQYSYLSKNQKFYDVHDGILSSAVQHAMQESLNKGTRHILSPMYIAPFEEREEIRLPATTILTDYFCSNLSNWCIDAYIAPGNGSLLDTLPSPVLIWNILTGNWKAASNMYRDRYNRAIHRIESLAECYTPKMEYDSDMSQFDPNRDFPVHEARLTKQYIRMLSTLLAKRRDIICDALRSGPSEALRHQWAEEEEHFRQFIHANPIAFFGERGVWEADRGPRTTLGSVWRMIRETIYPPAPDGAVVPRIGPDGTGARISENNFGDYFRSKPASVFLKSEQSEQKHSEAARHAIARHYTPPKDQGVLQLLHNVFRDPPTNGMEVLTGTGLYGRALARLAADKYRVRESESAVAFGEAVAMAGAVSARLYAQDNFFREPKKPPHDKYPAANYYFKPDPSRRAAIFQDSPGTPLVAPFLDQLESKLLSHTREDILEEIHRTATDALESSSSNYLPEYLPPFSRYMVSCLQPLAQLMQDIARIGEHYEHHKDTPEPAHVVLLRLLQILKLCLATGQMYETVTNALPHLFELDTVTYALQNAGFEILSTSEPIASPEIEDLEEEDYARILKEAETMQKILARTGSIAQGPFLPFIPFFPSMPGASGAAGGVVSADRFPTDPLLSLIHTLQKLEPMATKTLKEFQAHSLALSLSRLTQALRVLYVNCTAGTPGGEKHFNAGIRRLVFQKPETREFVAVVPRHWLPLIFNTWPHVATTTQANSDEALESALEDISGRHQNVLMNSPAAPHHAPSRECANLIAKCIGLYTSLLPTVVEDKNLAQELKALKELQTALTSDTKLVLVESEDENNEQVKLSMLIDSLYLSLTPEQKKMMVSPIEKRIAYPHYQHDLNNIPNFPGGKENSFVSPTSPNPINSNMSERINASWNPDVLHYASHLNKPQYSNGYTNILVASLPLAVAYSTIRKNRNPRIVVPNAVKLSLLFIAVANTATYFSRKMVADRTGFY